MTDSERIIELETRLAHMDDTLDTLNDIVTQQQQAIFDLERLVRRMAQEHREMKEQVAPDVFDSKPPHY